MNAPHWRELAPASRTRARPRVERIGADGAAASAIGAAATAATAAPAPSTDLVPGVPAARDAAPPAEPDPTEPDPTEPDPTEPDPTEPDPGPRPSYAVASTGVIDIVPATGARNDDAEVSR